MICYNPLLNILPNKKKTRLNKNKHELKELNKKRNNKQASYKYAYLEAFTNPVHALRTKRMNIETHPCSRGIKPDAVIDIYLKKLRSARQSNSRKYCAYISNGCGKSNLSKLHLKYSVIARTLEYMSVLASESPGLAVNKMTKHDPSP
jgi:hypothetical protein